METMDQWGMRGSKVAAQRKKLRDQSPQPLPPTPPLTDRDRGGASKLKMDKDLLQGVGGKLVRKRGWQPAEARSLEKELHNSERRNLERATTGRRTRRSRVQASYGSTT